MKIYVYTDSYLENLLEDILGAIYYERDMYWVGQTEGSLCQNSELLIRCLKYNRYLRLFT